MVQIKQQLVSDTPNKYGRKNKRQYITIHETDNFKNGADAQAHANLQTNGNSRSANWHWQVDDKEAIQSFTHDFQLWAGGDGRGNGNLNSIHIEMCVNADGDFERTMENTAGLVQKIMKDEGLDSTDVIRQHNYWSGKHCPRTIRDEGLWDDLLDMIEGKDVKVKVKTDTPTKTSGSNLIHRGDRGSAVRKLQNRLIELGYHLSYGADGIFGKETEKAVRAFQNDVGIKVDGLVGDKTKEHLRRKYENVGNDIDVDGYWGEETTEALQKALGTVEDGIISGQVRNSVTSRIYSGIRFGGGGSLVIKELQRLVGARVDGKLGNETIRKLQEYLGTTQDGKLSKPSLVVKEMQKRLNEGTFA